MDEETKSAVRRFLALLDDSCEIDGAIVYGSRARGTHRSDSDVDLAVLLAGPRRRFMPTALAMRDVAYDVYLDAGIDISPLPIWLDEWNNPDDHSNPDLLRTIADEGVRL